MAKDEIKTRITLEGDDAIKALRDLQREQEKYKDSTRDVGREAEDTSRKATGLAAAWQTLASGLQGLVASMLGVNGLRYAIQQVREEFEKAAQASRDFAQANLNLQFLSQNFDKQERAFVGNAAVLAGRPIEETTRAFTDLRSRFPNLAPQDVQALFLQVAETARTTDAPLSAINEGFATARQFINDPNAAQNTLRASIIQAGIGDPAQLAPLFAKAVPTLIKTGGLTPGQAFGAVAGATGLGLPGDVATTGLINTALNLTGQGTPEGSRILSRAGVDRSNLLTALEGVSGALQSGAIKPNQLEAIVGRDALAVAQLLTDPERLKDFEARVGAVASATASPRDLTAEAIQNQFGEDKVQAYNFAIKQAEVVQSLLEAPDQVALEAKLGELLQNIRARQEGKGPIARSVSGTIFKGAQSAQGLIVTDPNESLSYGLTETVVGDTNVGMANLIQFGVGYQARGSGAPDATYSEQLGQVRQGGVIYNDNKTINNNPIFHGEDPTTSDSGRRALP